MDINLNSFIQNAVYIQPVDGALQPFRFTQKQLDVYSGYDVPGGASRCPAGIALEFVTDASWISLVYSCKGFEDREISLDLLIDHCLEERIPIEKSSSPQEVHRYDIHKLPRMERRMTFLLPHLLEFRLHAVQLNDGASIRQTEPFRKKLLCYGDSITQGADARHPSCTYPFLLGKALGLQVLNQGVSGFMFNEQCLDPGLPFDPDYITVAYGTNDWRNLPTLQQFKDNCYRFLSRLKEIYPQARIAVITPLWRADHNTIASGVGEFSAVHSTIDAICRAIGGFYVIDGRMLVPHEQNYFGDRRLHPNEEGFQCMSDSLIRALQGWSFNKGLAFL
ncbi:MAG: lysophospholipase L1-like esterase [Paenibacillaceae bacterium]|nr:lysophospholipase L1-like esterase [Paenibacillaceae bacterium]